MKNTTTLPLLQGCNRCRLEGFFCTTPNGADNTTCPCCGGYDYLSANYRRKELEFLYEEEYDDDMRNQYCFCNVCHIVWDAGCMHYAGGCTDNTYNAHFIKTWKHRTTGEQFNGMPMFDSVQDWFDHVNDVEVLEMHCPHQGANCCREMRCPIVGQCEISLPQKNEPLPCSVPPHKHT